MTIEEYLVNVKEIYYQMFVIVKGKQILAAGTTRRLTDIRDSNGVLNIIRFSTQRYSALSLPAAVEISRMYSDRARIDFGGVHLVIWPVKEMNDDIQRDSTDDQGP